jgi:hypothetical protein
MTSSAVRRLSRPAAIAVAMTLAAVLLQGCLAVAAVGAGVSVAGAAVKTTGAVASAIIPGENGEQRRKRLKREKRETQKAERRAEKERREEERRR